MQVLINDLLEFSRVTAKAGEPEPTNCEFILKQVLSNLEIFIQENKAIVSHDPLPEVIADNTQLAQVLGLQLAKKLWKDMGDIYG